MKNTSEKKIGAGRPRKERTKHVRIPLSSAPGARSAIDFIMEMAKYKLIQEEWYRSCPDELKPGVQLTLKGLDSRVFAASNNFGGMAKTVLICIATEPTTNESFEIILRLDKI